MIKETALDKILYQIKKCIPKGVFDFFQPMYHRMLAYGGAMRYGFPSRGMKVIGITGTKGKSTTVYMITKILEASGANVAAIGSLGFKIRDKEWPNTLKMSMPGRFRLQKFLAEAKKSGCEYVVLEVTSEGIKQYRHLGITFDTAVFTNIHREHLETHGSFENYLHAKQELFKLPKRFHVLNADDPQVDAFAKFSVQKKITFGIQQGDIRPHDVQVSENKSEFKIKNETIRLHLGGEFNILNALAAWTVGSLYDVPDTVMTTALSEIKSVPGRLEFVQTQPFNVVVDYAHTPESLRQVYQTLGNSKKQNPNSKLIAVLGACGGGRDKWKRPEFGAIADKYADIVILTDEDPYDEDPLSIIKQIESGFKKLETVNCKLETVLDRKEAIGRAIQMAQPGDTVVITGKGSEVSMAVAGNRKIPWSDRDIARSFLS